MVDAAAEGDMAADIARDVELVRLGEDRGSRLAAPRISSISSPAFTGQPTASMSSITTRWLICTGRRSAAARRPPGDQFGRLAQPLEIGGRAQQRQHAVADQVHRRLVGRDQQQRRAPAPRQR
jgi:hypothetical protein